MTVPPVGQTTSGTSQQATGAAQSVDYQAFLKLLVTEMKNQDPTNPMKSTDYMAQLAAFSQVEQSVQMNSKLDDLLQTSALSQAGGLIGREIVSADGETSGTVKEVRLVSDGVVAVLDSGDEISVGPGVVVR